MICPKCKMSFEDIKESGVVGCAKCYEIFSEELKPIIKNMQKNTENLGKKPVFDEFLVKNEEINQLRRQLELAILEHRFDDASILDEKIKFLEGGEL